MGLTKSNVYPQRRRKIKFFSGKLDSWASQGKEKRW
nr:MAG TPA: hypothetical protein [Caudoviricetes sp.]